MSRPATPQARCPECRYQTTVPADASRRLSAIKDRVDAEKAVNAAEAGDGVDPEKIRASISTLEALLKRLEA